MTRIPARVRVLTSIAELPAPQWDVMAGADHPFTRHDFLLALEASKSAVAKTGWAPAHLVAVDDDGPIAAAPAWIKDHSHGEYIFDWGWADAAMRSGIRYYPKLLVGVPFTPATGPRLLVHPDADLDLSRAALAGAMWRVVEERGLSGAHVLFCTEDERAALATLGWSARSSMQYHWTNPGYRDFQDYLDAMTSRRRKEIRRERQKAQASGLELAMERVVDLTTVDVDSIWRCYQSTIGMHGAIPYLTEAWWRELPARLGESGVIATARRDGAIVAMAIGFGRGGHLYGRYWGALEEVPSLHFELCYYRYIEHAIAIGARRVEAGAQGEHKIARGFAPTETASAHRLVHPGLARAVAAHVTREAEIVRRQIVGLSEHLPFRADG